MLKMKKSELGRLRQESKAISNADRTIKRNSLVEFLQACAQFGILEEALAAITPPTAQRLKKWREDVRGHTGDYKVRFRHEAAQWAELDPAKLGDDVPASWEAPQVETDPGDPLADPVVPPTYRAPRWDELSRPRVIERDSRKFIALSDGVDFFEDDKVIAVQADAAIIGVFEKNDLPEDPEPPE